MEEKREGESNFEYLSRVNAERWKRQADEADARNAKILEWLKAGRVLTQPETLPK